MVKRRSSTPRKTGSGKTDIEARNRADKHTTSSPEVPTDNKDKLPDDDKKEPAKSIWMLSRAPWIGTPGVPSLSH